MKKSLFWLLIFFVFFTTYKPKSSFIQNSKLNIHEIIIENNSVLDANEIKQNLTALYEKSLFFLNIEDIEIKLKNINLIESFSVKKIYPRTLKIIIIEKEPIAILQNKKKKFYITNKGDVIGFRNLDIYNNLPIVLGNGNNFYSLYKNLESIKFPLEEIKSFYFFESGRWDLIMHDNKVLKLPINNYLYSLENFMKSINDNKFDTYKIFDYRIKNQIILN
jgi:cell division septal protein FtsQ